MRLNLSRSIFDVRYSIFNIVIVTVLAVVMTAGCRILEFGGDIAAVGPAYRQQDIATNSAALPDAGQPTTNLTALGEYRPAASNDDTRVLLASNEVVRWWTTFDDPVLTNLVVQACASNRTYLIAVERLRQANAARMSAFAALLPHAGADASAVRRETSGNTFTASQEGNNRYHYDDFAAGFNAAWEIDIFGGGRRAVQAANREAWAQFYTVQDAWVSLAASIGDAYIALRTVQARLDVARTNLVIQSDTLDILESRFKAGISDDLAVNQARYNTEQTRASIPLLLASEEAALNQLAVLSGALPGELHGVLTNRPAGRTSWLVAPRRLEAMPLAAIRNRPDVRASERHLAAAVANIGVAESLLLPKFYLNGTLGLESAPISDLLNRKSLYGSLGPSASWPLLQGGATLAQIETAKSKMNEALLRYQLTVQQAYQDVRDSLSAYTQEYHCYQSLAAAVRAAADACRLAQERYKSGISDFNNVLDAQRSQLTLEEALTVSGGSISRDLIALYRSLGGGL